MQAMLILLRSFSLTFKKPSFPYFKFYGAEVPKLEHTMESQGDLEKPLTLDFTPRGSGVLLGHSLGTGRSELQYRRLPGSASVSNCFSRAEGLTLPRGECHNCSGCEASVPSLSLWVWAREYES